MPDEIKFYYIDLSVLLENTPLVKFVQNHIWDSSGIFSISSLVNISMISLIPSLSLKLYLYLNLLVYNRNIFGSSSKVFGNLWKSLENVREPLESGQKSSKMPSSVCLDSNLSSWHIYCCDHTRLSYGRNPRLPK